ncbi:minor allergen Can f 2-like [Dromiciops gliroides]|uniref:minor allergen Can f 2-like n=1 Tax=Dromiciops gliroides TaxID=33562 RepID=UPI001CC50DED|nr:minor allergen Can f 2-like [Dromiciops gliroides]
MKIILLTLGLCLVCGLQALDNNTEDPSGLDGEWYTVALGSNRTSKIEEGGTFRKFVKYINERDGYLHGKYLKKENNECTFLDVIAFTGANGQLQVEYDGHNEFSIQSIGSNYVIIIVYNIKNGKVTVVSELYDRCEDLSVKIMTRPFYGFVDERVKDVSLKSVGSDHAIFISYNFNNGNMIIWAELYVPHHQ